MKKSTLILLTSLILLYGFVFGQKDIPLGKSIDIKLNANAFTDMGKAIQEVSLDFCNQYGKKEVSYNYIMGDTQDICFTLFNGSNTGVTVNLTFVDGMFTNDQRKNKACGQSDDIDAFGQYVTGYETRLDLKKGEMITRHAKVRYPKDLPISPTNLNGCLVYSLISDTPKEAAPLGLGVVVRKAKFISLHIKKASIFDNRYLILCVALMLIGVVSRKYFLRTRTSK